LAGAKKGGLLQTIVGVILVAVDYIYSYGSSGLSSVGWALIAGGVSQMLFAPPRAQQPPDRPDARASYAFDGAVNTAAQGNAVPICYGRVICGSQVISAGLAAEALSLDA
jgi:predicted phage tail protein